MVAAAHYCITSGERVFHQCWNGCKSLNTSSRGNRLLKSLLLSLKWLIELIDMIRARSSLVTWHSYRYWNLLQMSCMNCLSISTIGALWCYCCALRRSNSSQHDHLSNCEYYVYILLNVLLSCIWNFSLFIFSKYSRSVYLRFWQKLHWINFQ